MLFSLCSIRALRARPISTVLRKNWVDWRFEHGKGSPEPASFVKGSNAEGSDDYEVVDESASSVVERFEEDNEG
jgi:hypothetical protein